MSTKQEVRYCADCATRLARDNVGEWCSACLRSKREAPQGPPDLSREFWYTDQMLDAFETRHMGLVIAVYRNHPLHGKRLYQSTVCHWLDMTQANLSRLENGDPPEDLGKLIQYARILGMPAELLWFKLPGVNHVDMVEDSAQAGVLRGTVEAGGTLPLSGTATYTRDQVALTIPEQSELVDRRNFLTASAGAGAAALAATPVLNFLAALNQAALPAEVRPGDIEQVRSAARLFTGWSHAYGGGIVREAVIAQLRWSAELLEASCPERLRPELFSAVGDLSGVAGFMAFDAYAHDDANRMFVFGLSCAEEAGDWHLRARLLTNMARQATWCDDPETGLTRTELALVRPDRLAASELAWVHAGRARALARLGRVQEAHRAILQADEAFGNRNISEDPPWMAFYTGAEHAGDTGLSLYEIGLHGTVVTDPGIRLRAAVAGHSNGYVRSRAMGGVVLATHLVANGDPYEGIAMGNQALDDAQGLRSRRVTDQLRSLRQASSQHETIQDARELGGRITELVGA